MNRSAFGLRQERLQLHHILRYGRRQFNTGHGQRKNIMLESVGLYFDPGGIVQKSLICLVWVNLYRKISHRINLIGLEMLKKCSVPFGQCLDQFLIDRNVFAYDSDIKHLLDFLLLEHSAIDFNLSPVVTVRKDTLDEQLLRPQNNSSRKIF